MSTEKLYLIHQGLRPLYYLLASNQHFPLSIFKPHSIWWAVIDVSIKFESPVVFVQLRLMGSFLLQHPQKVKKQKQTTDTPTALEDKGCHCTWTADSLLTKSSGTATSSALWRNDSFQGFKTQCPIQPVKGNRRLVPVAARSSWNWELHKVLRYVQTSLGIRSRRETGISGLFRV